MQPIAVMPLHDPDGIVLAHLDRLTSLLELVFETVYLGLTPRTQEIAFERFPIFYDAGLYQIFPLANQEPVGDQFSSLYRFAAQSVRVGQVLHLCFPDRVAFALQECYRHAFIYDMTASSTLQAPLIYHRTQAAWSTHPQNYADIEGFVTRTGELLFGKMLDFAWCQLAIPAGRLLEVLRKVRNHDLSMVAEIVLVVREEAQTIEVDWLAWEDPFIMGVDPGLLKRQREHSLDETRKRLGYAIPMLQRLFEEIQK